MQGSDRSDRGLICSVHSKLFVKLWLLCTSKRDAVLSSVFRFVRASKVMSEFLVQHDVQKYFELFKVPDEPFISEQGATFSGPGACNTS